MKKTSARQENTSSHISTQQRKPSVTSRRGAATGIRRKHERELPPRVESIGYVVCGVHEQRGQWGPPPPAPRKDRTPTPLPPPALPIVGPLIVRVRLRQRALLMNRDLSVLVNSTRTSRIAQAVASRWSPPPRRAGTEDRGNTPSYLRWRSGDKECMTVGEVERVEDRFSFFKDEEGAWSAFKLGVLLLP